MGKADGFKKQVSKGDMYIPFDQGELAFTYLLLFLADLGISKGLVRDIVDDMKHTSRQRAVEKTRAEFAAKFPYNPQTPPTHSASLSSNTIPSLANASSNGTDVKG